MFDTWEFWAGSLVYIAMISIGVAIGTWVRKKWFGGPPRNRT